VLQLCILMSVVSVFLQEADSVMPVKSNATEDKSAIQSTPFKAPVAPPPVAGREGSAKSDKKS